MVALQVRREPFLAPDIRSATELNAQVATSQPLAALGRPPLQPHPHTLRRRDDSMRPGDSLNVG